MCLAHNRQSAKVNPLPTTSQMSQIVVDKSSKGRSENIIKMQMENLTLNQHNKKQQLTGHSQNTMESDDLKNRTEMCTTALKETLVISADILVQIP